MHVYLCAYVRVWSVCKILYTHTYIYSYVELYIRILFIYLFTYMLFVASKLSED